MSTNVQSTGEIIDEALASAVIETPAKKKKAAKSARTTRSAKDAGPALTVSAPSPRAAKQAAKREAAASAAQRATDIRQTAFLVKQVSDPTRLQIILMLSEEERNVGDMSKQTGQSQPAISHHLSLLRHRRLIEPNRRGKNIFYRITDEGEMLANIVRQMIEG